MRKSNTDRQRRTEEKDEKNFKKKNKFLLFCFLSQVVTFISAFSREEDEEEEDEDEDEGEEPQNHESLLEPRVHATRDTKRRGLEEGSILYLCVGKIYRKNIICKRAAFAQKGRARKKRETSKRRRRRWANNKNQGRLYVSCVANLTSFRNDLGKSSRTSSHLCKKTNGSVRFFYRTTSTPNESISRAVCGARKCITTTKKND